MWRTVTYLMLTTCLYLGICAGTSSRHSPESESARESPKKADSKGSALIDVKISSPTKAIKVGETVQIRVEIWNIGEEDVFLCKNFAGHGLVYCSLRLSLEDSDGTHGSQIGLAADTFPVKKEAFANALARDWIALPAGHFYGAIMRMGPESFPSLTKPGKYRIQGEYSSGGLLAPLYYNNLLAFPTEIERLPAKNWTGNLVTNTLSIQVL